MIAVSAQDRCNSQAGNWAQRLSVPMPPVVNLGRKRNKVKCNIWGFYLKGEGKESQNTLKSLKAAARTHKARVPGSANQALVLQKVSRNKVQNSWHRPVSADAATRVLKLALGENWRNIVTDPAGVQGADQTVATAEEESPQPTPGASCSGTFASRTATAEEAKVEAATLAPCSKPHLLSMKLEMITASYKDKNRSHYNDLQQAYSVNWAAELGQGTYGKVYLGMNVSATDTADLDTRTPCFAIKMLRDKDTETKKTHADAVWAADQEVRRHAALGVHPNIVGLVDVGLFWEPPNRPGCNSRTAHIGLVCDMYETDVH